MKINPLTGYLLIAIAALVLVIALQFDRAGKIPAPSQLSLPVIHGDDPVKGGSTNAPVVLVGFGSYTCSTCEKLSELLNAAVQRFGKEILITWRDVVPPGVDVVAQDAAIAARCAAEQGRYWDAHDALFGSASEIRNILPTLPEEIGLNTETFAQCVERQDTLFAAQEGIAEARALGLEAMPALYVNDMLLYGVPEEKSFLDWLETRIP